MSTIKTTTLSTQGGSTVPVDTVVNGTAKAWVNFNGTGTVAIRRAFNVSSVSDLGTGTFRANMTTALEDANYAVASGGSNTTRSDVVFAYPISTTSFGVFGMYPQQSWPVGARDISVMTAAIFS